MQPIGHRGNVVTYVGVKRGTPIAEHFRLIAGPCLESARKLRGATIGRYILTAHALELGLKAFLAKQGLTRKELAKKPYEHNLDRLYREAVKRGLKLEKHGLDPDVEYAIAKLNEYWKSALLRYDVELMKQLPQCDALFPFINALLDASAPSSGKCSSVTALRASPRLC